MTLLNSEITQNTLRYLSELLCRLCGTLRYLSETLRENPSSAELRREAKLRQEAEGRKETIDELSRLIFNAIIVLKPPQHLCETLRILCEPRRYILPNLTQRLAKSEMTETKRQTSAHLRRGVEPDGSVGQNSIPCCA